MVEQTIDDLMQGDVGLGMDLYDPSKDNKIGFIKIIQKLSQESVDLEEGAIINGSLKTVLANFGESFNFIPLYYFKDYAIWSKEFVLVKRSTKKEDFTKEELEWVDKTPPLAQESINFVVVEAKEMATPMILSFNRTNFKKGQQFCALIQDTMTFKNIPMFGAIYSISTTEEKKGKHSWFVYTNAKFVEKIQKVDAYKKLKSYYTQIAKTNINNMLALEAGESEKSTPVLEETIDIKAEEKY